MSYQLYADLGFTENEELYSKVSHKRLLEFIRSKRYHVVSSCRSTNNYGEFWFVTLACKRRLHDEAVTFYGNGYHEYRERTLNTWSFCVGNSWSVKDKPALRKPGVISEIENERKNMTFDQGSGSNLFSALSDIMDEDGAYAELYM